MSDGPIDYLELTREGLRSVMARALEHAAQNGLYEEQHFFLTFLTDHPGVVMPDWLKAQYPQEITIVLQYEYHDLAVMPDRFSVGLSFNARLATLVVPFSAVRTFADPSVNFRIDIPLADDVEEAHPAISAGDEDGALPAPSEMPEESGGERTEGTVVSLDAFRKK